MDGTTTPPIMTTLAPLLSVRDGARAADFYQTAFGARQVFRVEDEAGQVVARLRIDQAEFWVSDESPDHQNFSPETLEGSTVRVILTVAEPDKVFSRALSAGASEISPVGEAYGWRIGRLVDPFGHHWEIGHPIATDCAALN